MTQAQPVRPRSESRITEGDLGIVRLSTIIAFLPGIAEQSVRATFESLPSVTVAGSASGCLSALQMVRDRQADLVVLDANLPLEDVQASSGNSSERVRLPAPWSGRQPVTRCARTPPSGN